MHRLHKYSQLFATSKTTWLC